MPRIEFHDVSLHSAERSILTGVSLTLTERRIGVIGANGSGKSTLVRLINGLLMPTSGQVMVDGMDTRRSAKAIRQQVGFIFPDADNQIIMPTVAEDVEFTLRVAQRTARATRARTSWRHNWRGDKNREETAAQQQSFTREQRKERTQRTLDELGLTQHADQSPHVLSSGEKQLLALASVLVGRPKLIIADEPTTLLDLGNRRRIAATFAQLPQQLIVVTHDLDLLENFDRVLCVADGRIVDDSGAEGFPSDSPQQVVQRYRERFA